MTAGIVRDNKTRGRFELDVDGGVAFANYRLTPQEIELLKLLVDGHLYKTAAHELGITTNTVSFHLRNIYTKLEVHSKVEAVAKALREGLV